MITVRDLARKLAAYPDQNTEVMIQFDGDVAFPFLDGQDHTAMGFESGPSSKITKYKFLVLRADQKGTRLMLKGSG